MTADDLVKTINEATKESHNRLIEKIKNLTEEEKNEILLKFVYAVSILRGE